MARKGGLGRGLDALIPSSTSSSAPTTEGTVTAPIERIIPNPLQPRAYIKPEELSDLAESIREHGIIQPLIVTQDDVSGDYILIAGERRLRASQMLGLEYVPVVVRQANNQQRLELALIENIQRADLTPLETAEAYRQLHENFELSHEEIARRVGKSRVTVTNHMRLLKLPETVRQALATGQITEGHARALLGLPSPQSQAAALQPILRQDLNVRQTEALVRRLNGEKPPAALPRVQPPDVVDLQTRLENHLGTRVTLNTGKRGGTLILHYYSPEELDTLISHLLKD